MGSWNPWDHPRYSWVVICKNKRFHHHTNTLFGHKIPLAESDAFSPTPAIPGPFRVLCDECGQEHSYKPKEVLRLELRHPESFTPHPLFLDPTSIKASLGKSTNNEPADKKPSRVSRPSLPVLGSLLIVGSVLAAALYVLLFYLH